MFNIQIKTVDDVNKVLTGLSELPHKTVSELIQDILQQAVTQIKAAETAKAQQEAEDDNTILK